MHLVSLEARGIHGFLDYRHTFGRVSVIIADNDAGKSSLLGLIALALNGNAGATFPVLGTSPTYDWSVSTRFDDGTVVARWMERGEHKATYNGIGGRLAGVREKVAAALGRASAWSVDDFLALTPQKRMPFLQSSVLTGVGWTLERLQARLDADGATERLPRVIKGFDVAAHVDGRVALTELIAVVERERSSANSDALRLDAVVKHDDLETRDDKLPEGTIPSWTGRRAALAREREAHVVNKAGIAGEKRARETVQRDVDAKRSDLAGLQARDWDAEATAIDERIRTADEAIHAAAAALRAAHDEQVRAKNTTTARDEAVQAARAANNEAIRAVATQEARAKAARLADRVFSALQATVDRLRAAAVRDDDDAMKGAIALLEERARVVDDATTLATQAAAREAAETASGADTMLEAARRAEAKAGRDVATAQEVLRRANEAKAAIVEERGRHAEERAGAGDSAATLARWIEEGEEQLGKLGTGDVAAIDEAIAVLDEQMRECDTAIGRLNDATERLASREAHRADLDAARSRRTAAKELGEILSPMLEDMLRDLVAPLEEPIRTITRPVLGADFRVRLDDGVGFELVFPGGRRAPLDSNRSARAVAMVALRCAVQQRLGGWRHLVLDDMENLQQTRRTAFLQSMLEETAAGRLDNFVGAVVDDGWTPPPGVHVIRLPSR